MSPPLTHEATWRKATELVADVGTLSPRTGMVAIEIEGAHALFEANSAICERFDEQARRIAFQMCPAPRRFSETDLWKHCENLFGKVGVETRLSSGLLARETL